MFGRLVLSQSSTLTPVERPEEEHHMLPEAVPVEIDLAADTAGLGERFRNQDFDRSLLVRTVVAVDSLLVAGSRHKVDAAVADNHPVDTLHQLLTRNKHKKEQNESLKRRMGIQGDTFIFAVITYNRHHRLLHTGDLDPSR
jgi:hypothetical protein